ncbi:MAG: penicillin-binding protein 2 [Alphaproteobacteria bacterium]|nr:penicillin-binding protein 2 [Alphaproteobacteria bacterium]
MNRDNDKGKILLYRTLYVAGFSMIALVCLMVRLYDLQILEGEKYKTLSDENRISTRILVPPRGKIYDRNDVLLATNQQNFQALIIAEQTPDVAKTVDSVAKLIDLNDIQKQKILSDVAHNRPFMPVKLKDNLSFEDMALLQLNAPDLPGVVIDEGINRVYPLGHYTAHFLGYVGAVSDQDVLSDPLLSVPGFKVGKYGLEKVFESRLRGKSGSLKLEVNAFGRVMKEIDRQNGIEGQMVHLTIDSRLQKIAQDAFGDQSGAAVALDVHSGEILAFVSVPSFDPNLFTTGVPVNIWQDLLSNERKPLNNKVVSEHYSPGSTFKIVVALAALEAGVIDKNTRFHCSGVMTFGNHKFHCWKHSGPGWLNVVEALKHSCDIFFYETALKVGIEKIAEMAHILGFEDDYHLGFANMQKGVIPTKAWKEQRFKSKWQQGETVIAGIGQGYVLVTPLQLAVSLARVINGGYEVVPTFEKLSLKQKSKIVKLPISAENLEIVKQGLYEVVNGEGGTARRAAFNIDGARMGGKTGTTQVRRITLHERKTGIVRDEDLDWRLRNHALFVGYAPHDKPKYAVAVVVEHGSSGSGVAAPIASKILRAAIELGI